MPKWIHDRAKHLMKMNPEMGKSLSFAISTQQAYASGKAPKNYGTQDGRMEASIKYPKSKKHYKKTPDPKTAGLGAAIGGLISKGKNLASKAAPSLTSHKKQISQGLAGAGVGAASGFASSGGYDNQGRKRSRITGALKGGLVGGVLGGTAKYTMPSIRRGYSNAKSYLGSKATKLQVENMATNQLAKVKELKGNRSFGYNMTPKLANIPNPSGTGARFSSGIPGVKGPSIPKPSSTVLQRGGMGPKKKVNLASRPSASVPPIPNTDSVAKSVSPPEIKYASTMKKAEWEDMDLLSKDFYSGIKPFLDKEF